MEVLVRYGTAEQKRTLARAAARRRDPLLLRDDRARRRLVGRDQHPIAHRARRRRLRHQRPQVVHLRRRRSALQDRDLHGQDRPRRAAPPAAVDDPGADGHARRDHPPHAAGVRLRRRAARARGDHLRERARAGERTCCSAKGAASRSRRGGSGPGRIHHCMRLDRPGRARARGDVPARADSASAFGKPLAEQGTIRADIAESRMEIEQARLLTLQRGAADGHGRQQGGARARSR